MSQENPRPKYDPKAIEKKWQDKWKEDQTYRTTETADKPKYYVLDMFPYPSGEGLHVGHPKGYIATDVVSRMKRMQGFNVLHPMGFDAFGLPAEQYAIKMKVNPAVAVEKNVARYKKQLEILGFDYDWSREVNTTDPKYYKWTQWIFLKLLEHGLAEERYEPINWCPVDKTGLSNEDIEDGKCERCGATVEKRLMKQWVLKITKYADRMLADLDATTSDIPLIKKTDGDDKIREDMPFVEREAAVCIVKHWSEDKYLCSSYKNNGWHGFIVGGIEDGEDVGKAAAREVHEESGYRNAKYIRTIGYVDSQFYHAVKKVNRFAHFTVAYLELQDDARDEMSQEEKDLHEVLWLTKDEVAAWVNREDISYIWDLFIGKKTQKGKVPLLDWPESIKESQRNWIGRSEGMLFTAPVKDTELTLQTFSAHFEACYADTFVSIAPDHPFLAALLEGTGDKGKVLAFSKSLIEKRSAQGFEEEKESEGIFTGRYIVDPLGNGDLPIWVASFALADYGTGIVKCSAHDERDFRFAKKYNIPLKTVIYPEDKAEAEKVRSLDVCFSDMKNGILSEPAEFEGKKGGEIRKEMIDFLVKNNLAAKKTTYKLREWVFSRQRYWGEPIPMLHDEAGKIMPLSVNDLPLELPPVEQYEPTDNGESPLANITEWVNVEIDGKKYRRETNTMPQWAGSSWYYLRYMDPKNETKLVDPSREKYWNSVDLYVGGAEHATRHLIYARFWHKFLFDIGVVSTIEPFTKLQSVGLIMASDGRKMSKRWGNVINPDEMVETFGADSMRLYEMFMGPFDQAIAWNTNGVVGTRRFIEKVWKLSGKVIDEYHSGSHEVLLNQTIKKVTEDISDMKFNTAISTLMIFVNALESAEKIAKMPFESLLKLLAPFAPHVAEELWAGMGNTTSIHLESWPSYDPAKIEEDTVNIAIQINGKTREVLATVKDLTEDAVVKAALALPEVLKWTKEMPIKRIIWVKNRILNLIIDL